MAAQTPGRSTLVVGVLGVQGGRAFVERLCLAVQRRSPRMDLAAAGISFRHQALVVFRRGSRLGGAPARPLGAHLGAVGLFAMRPGVCVGHGSTLAPVRASRDRFASSGHARRHLAVDHARPDAPSTEQTSSVVAIIASPANAIVSSARAAASGSPAPQASRTTTGT